MHIGEGNLSDRNDLEKLGVGGRIIFKCIIRKCDGNMDWIRKRHVVKHNVITEVYLMTVMETTTCFGLYWPSSGCLVNVRAS